VQAPELPPAAMRGMDVAIGASGAGQGNFHPDLSGR